MNAHYSRSFTITLLFVMSFAARSAHGQSDTGVEEELTLDAVIMLARERNQRLASAEAVVDAKKQLEPSAGLPPDPMFQIGARNLRLPDFTADMPNSMAPSLQVVQTFPFPGKLSLGKRIARQSTSISSANAAETWWEVRTAVAAAFFDVYGADRQLEVMRVTLRLLHDFEAVARAMYGTGTGRQSDVLRANVEVSRMDTEIARMEAMRIGAAARLNALLDLPAATPVPSPRLPRLPKEVPDRDTLRDWTETSRPLIHGARTEVERARSQYDLARKQVWPDLAIGVHYGQRDVDDDTRRMASFLVGFNLPVFAGSRQLRMRDEAVALERVAEATLDETRAWVDARIEQLLADLDQGRTLVDLYREEILPEAEANVESAFSLYRIGDVDFLTLVDAQTTKNRFEQEYYQLLARYGTAVAELEMTVGRELPMAPALLAEVR